MTDARVCGILAAVQIKGAVAVPVIRTCLLFAALAAALSLVGCKNNLNGDAYALTGGGKIIAFTTAKPTDITHTITISGLPLDPGTGLASENVVQMDYRPSDQQLYAITGANHLYLIDPATGVATLLDGGATFSNDSLGQPQMDFDPVRDLIRIISSNDNLQVNPDTGLSSSGTTVAYAGTDINYRHTPSLAGIAYSNNVAGVGSTTLYALDSGTQSMARVGSPGGSPVTVDSGVLYTVGRLGVSFGVNDGFDIDSKNGTAFAALSPQGGTSSLYTINLANGTASRIGTIGDGSITVTALAVVPAG